MDRSDWQTRLATEEASRGYSQGFKFLYCPWSTLDTGTDVFLSLNPGKPPEGVDLRTVSDERGNSYVVERETTQSPITEQFIKFCALLETPPEKMLTGVVMPYRTERWLKKRDDINLDIAFDFWSQVLAKNSVRRVFCLGRDSERVVLKLTGARLSAEIQSGWGNYTIRRYDCANGLQVFGLLHFSTFKMMSNAACVRQLQHLIFEL